MCCHLPGTAKKMMISGSCLHEEVQLRPNDLQEVLRKAASEGCEATREEVRPHQPVQGAVKCAMFIHRVRHEELKDQWQSDAAAQKKHRQPDDEAQMAAWKYVLSIWSFLTHVLKSMQ